MVKTGSPIALGLRAARGGAVAVALQGAPTEPVLLRSVWLPVADPSDRIAFEPFTWAFETHRAGGATLEAISQAVVDGRSRQALSAEDNLGAFLTSLGDDPVSARVALLVNRAGWVGELLAYSLDYDAHAAVAEGLAVREAFRAAGVRLGAPMIELDEKTLGSKAQNVLNLDPAGLDQSLGGMGHAAGRPWRKEQKAAALAAWIALAGAA